MSTRKPALKISIPGKPRPQGSVTPMVSRSTGKSFVKYGPTTVEHRNFAIGKLAKKWKRKALITGPVVIKYRFMFARPKSHFGTGRNAEKLKDSAPDYHARIPDLDKLERLMNDALVLAGVIKDDSQVAGHDDSWKGWTTGLPKTKIWLYEL